MHRRSLQWRRSTFGRLEQDTRDWSARKALCCTWRILSALLQMTFDNKVSLICARCWYHVKMRGCSNQNLSPSLSRWNVNPIIVSRSRPIPIGGGVWTTVNTKLGSGFHQILGVLIGLSRCYVNDRPLVAIAGYRSSWLVLMAMEKSDCCLCGTALPVKTRKLLYGKAATGARTTLKRICEACGTLDCCAAKSESPQYICHGCKKLLLRISREEDELGQLGGHP